MGWLILDLEEGRPAQSNPQPSIMKHFEGKGEPWIFFFFVVVVKNTIIIWTVLIRINNFLWIYEYFRRQIDSYNNKNKMISTFTSTYRNEGPIK